MFVFLVLSLVMFKQLRQMNYKVLPILVSGRDFVELMLICLETFDGILQCNHLGLRFYVNFKNYNLNFSICHKISQMI